jgi:hypothetical protein
MPIRIINTYSIAFLMHSYSKNTFVQKHSRDAIINSVIILDIISLVQQGASVLSYTFPMSTIAAVFSASTPH